MIQPEDILSMTDFKRDTAKHLRRLKKSGRPGVLTVNGRAEAVVMDPAAYSELVEAVDMADAVAAIRQSMKEFDEGKGMPAREALERIRRRRKSA